MKRKLAFLTVLLATLVVSTVFVACDKDDDPVELTLKTLVAGDIDMNGATSPSNIPANPTIVATFSTAVDAATAVAANIKLTQDYDDANIALTITVSGSTVTIVPQSELGGGALYLLEFTAGLKSTEGKFLTALRRSFTTVGTFVPAGVIAYWPFNDDANDAVGAYDPATAGVLDVTYTAGRSTAAGNAATFNGTSSLIEVPNGDDLMNTTDFTISFWVKTNSADKTNGHFVMGLAGWFGFQYEIFGGYDGAKFAYQYNIADTMSASEDMWFPSLATDNTNGGWMGWTYAKSLTADEMMAKLKDAWLHVTYTYEANLKVGTLYYNGEKMKSFDFNLWPDGDAKRGVIGLKYAGAELGNKLAFGFIQARDNRTIGDEWADPTISTNNHFKGQLDDVRIFHKPLTATEISLMYNSEKP